MNICFDTNGIDLPPMDDDGKGDLNEDGVLNILDQYILFNCALNNPCEISSNSDLNEDGIINVSDVQLLGNNLLSTNDRTITVANMDGNPIILLLMVVTALMT